MTFDDDETPRASMYLTDQKNSAPSHPQLAAQSSALMGEKSDLDGSGEGPSQQRPPLPNFLQFVTDSTNASSIAERAWMMKMANEMARRYEEERIKGSFGLPSPKEETASPPPAYAR